MSNKMLVADGFFIPIIVIVNCVDVVTLVLLIVESSTEKLVLTKLREINVGEVTVHNVFDGSVYP